MKFVDYVKGKLPGFWVSVSLVFFSIVVALTWLLCFRGTEEMSYWGFSFLLIGAVGGAALIAFKKYDFATYVLGAGLLLGILFYLNAVYYYVSVVMVGIDLDHFSTEFLVTTTLFVIGFIASLVNIFLPQTKAVEEVTTESEDK